MSIDLAATGLSESQKAQALAHWDRRWRALERRLAAFDPEERSVRLLLSAQPPWCEARVVLMLPTGTLTARGRSRLEEPAGAVDEAADKVLTELHGHNASLRRAFLFDRRRRRRGDLSGILPVLKECRERGDREAFDDLLRPALRELREHARRELVLAQLENIVPPGSLSVSALLSELVQRAWERFERRPPGVRLELWLTRELHDALDGRGAETAPPPGARLASDDARLSARETDGGPPRPGAERLTLADVVPGGRAGTAWDRATDDEQRAWILSRLRGFPRTRRRAFTLYALEGWNDDEVAAILGRSPEDVLLDIDRVRDALIERLEDDEAGFIL
ncbi:MAG TPA: hypothetical protein VD971_07185 [Phycisphaerales bacterium]|nr:hypothetical protein [Phycisphaerales bacterium]